MFPNKWHICYKNDQSNSLLVDLVSQRQSKLLHLQGSKNSADDNILWSRSPGSGRRQEGIEETKNKRKKQKLLYEIGGEVDGIIRLQKQKIFEGCFLLNFIDVFIVYK